MQPNVSSEVCIHLYVPLALCFDVLRARVIHKFQSIRETSFRNKYKYLAYKRNLLHSFGTSP